MGDFPILIKQFDALNEYVLDHHPFDVVGWDGYFYPWIFSIHDFEPIVGRVHQPPPVHQTFQGDGFVICSFCPRPYDFGENAIPAPYNHSNVDSDEVIFYASEEFMSRKGIEFGSVTHHPDGIPHGPHPGRYEASIGQKFTNELAVMMDSFRPLKVAKAVTPSEDASYHRSWIEAQHARVAAAATGGANGATEPAPGVALPLTD
jgi:homogentisate 1,2-dioxygenase